MLGGRLQVSNELRLKCDSRPQVAVKEKLTNINLVVGRQGYT